MKKKSHLKRETHRTLANQETNILRELGRMSAGAYYQHQQTRIATFNQIRDIIYRKMEGLDLTELQEKKPEEEKYLKKYQDRYLDEYRRILQEEGKLTDQENRYIKKVLEVQKQSEKYEKEYQKLMQEYVESEPIYTEFLSKIRGISAVLSANLIKEFGHCENAPHISSLWKYCGMHVINGEAPKRKKGVKLDFSLKRRTMVWKISDSFIKQRTPFYREIYDREKERQLKLMEGEEQDKVRNQQEVSEPMDIRNPTSISEPLIKRNPKSVSVPKNKMHCDLRARRKMVKIFLAHYWQACKELYNQPNNIRYPSKFSEPKINRKPLKFSEPMDIRNPISLSEPYVSSKLRHKHISYWRDAIKEIEEGKVK